MPQPVVSSKYLFFRSPPKIVLVLNPASRPISMKLTSSTDGFSCGAGEAAGPGMRGMAMPRTWSNDKTSAVSRKLRRVKDTLERSTFVVQFHGFDLNLTIPMRQNKLVLPALPTIAFLVFFCLPVISLGRPAGSALAQKTAPAAPPPP